MRAPRTQKAAAPWTLHHGEALAWLRTLPDGYADSIVTDPPYGLSEEPDPAAVLAAWLTGKEYAHRKKGFMEKAWDSLVPGPPLWREALRVLRPGGYLFAFAGTRTWDLMSMALRLAGFTNRDTLRHEFPTLAWVQGQGMPKSKALLKPAWEPILMFRKKGPLRPLRREDCLVPRAGSQGSLPTNFVMSHGNECGDTCEEECPVRLLGEQSGVLHGAGSARTGSATPRRRRCQANVFGVVTRDTGRMHRFGDIGTAARFFPCFYEPKASRRERNEGCEGLPEKPAGPFDDDAYVWKTDGHGNERQGKVRPRQNHHSCVKPVNLMKWLCRLTTPVGGLVLDPFAGSGSTGSAALAEGLRFAGCERDSEYVEIARARLKHAHKETAR